MKGRLKIARVHELQVGDMFRELGNDYKVMKREKGKFHCSTVTEKGTTGSSDGKQYGHTMGVNSKKIIQKYCTE